MREQNKKALTYSALGVTAVILVAFLTNLFAPQSKLGEGLRFLAPLLTGLIAGLILFLKLGGYNPEVLEELPETEEEA